ncbi:MAG: class I SAM-dependent methyltransferase [Cyclobacteriaceae bacterium]|jgi:SAM-dependent methyltransferase|nr:class I SAM-dependent methyltransferase [Cyclobacteriaceae bacterium]
MASVYTTEITSETILSDNPIHQRLLRPYILASDYVKGNLLEVGCGEGRGIDWLLPHIESYTAIDKILPVIEGLKKKYPQGKFLSGNIPPLTDFEDNSFDSVVSFQVIEHIKNDALFLKEIYRVLKPGGVALITTPNRPLSLSRNPWHIREYTASELTNLAKRSFSSVTMMGIAGNEKVMQYHEQNRQSVARLMRWDIFNLQYILPASILRIPYEIMNRINRNKLKNTSDELVMSIRQDDYVLTGEPNSALDLFLIARK